MPTYKLYYFNVRANAETIRLIFAQAGVEYEDIRLTPEEWAEFEPTTPHHGLPVLDIDGKLFGGAKPITRYLAKQFRLAPEDEMDNLILEGAVDALRDITLARVKSMYETDPVRKAELKKYLEEEVFPRVLGSLEKFATENSESPDSFWFYGKEVTYLDINFFNVVDAAGEQYPHILEKYPTLKKIKEAVGNLPNIAKWIKERPTFSMPVGPGTNYRIKK